jgi:hypothetical protein
MTEDLKKIKNDCPVFLDDIKDIIKDLQEDKNHVVDLSGVEQK